MSEPTAIPASGNADVDPSATRESFLRRWRWWLIIGGPVAILAIVAYFILTGGRTETTDNAYVQIAKVPVAANVGGRVTDVYVRWPDNRARPAGTAAGRGERTGSRAHRRR